MSAAPPPAAPPATRPLHDALFHYYCEFDAPALIRSFADPGRAATPGQIVNFLGTRIEPSVFPPVLTALEGRVEGVPNPGNWHADIAEWAAALRSVELARGSYRIIEVGCGWGCWITNMGVAARRRGLTLALVGVEGDETHLGHAREVLELNGFHAGEYALHHGIAGPTPGKAIFPRSGGTSWGGAAIFDPSPDQVAAARRDPAVALLDCLTLADLSDGEPVDLLHVDIQGAEVDFVRGNFDGLGRLVRRVLIGTHSRIIEGQLCEIFLDAGWRLEMERPAIAPLADGTPRTRIDGVQMWANPARS